MPAINYTYHSGDTRYYIEVGTTTASTITSFVSTATSANGAFYHSMQVDTLSFITSTGQMVAMLQGSIDMSAPVYWYEMNRATLTAAGTTTLISAGETARWVRGIISSINTQGAFSINMKLMGQAPTYGR